MTLFFIPQLARCRTSILKLMSIFTLFIVYQIAPLQAQTLCDDPEACNFTPSVTQCIRVEAIASHGSSGLDRGRHIVVVRYLKQQSTGLAALSSLQ